MAKKTKLIVTITILGVLCLIYVIYSRPQTIEMRYPALNLSECIEISGSYHESIEDVHHFVITPDDPYFQEFVELFQSSSFSNTLWNLFPNRTKTHTGPGIRWTISFRFDSLTLEDGSIAHNSLLSIDNFYGSLELFFDGVISECKVKNYENWNEKVLNIVTQYGE